MLGQAGRLGRTPEERRTFPGSIFDALNHGDEEAVLLTIREQRKRKNCQQTKP
jgi:hypothetical protein